MGLCSEFGPRIAHDCDAAMVAGSSSCSCPACGAVCLGRFEGCASVWARGPQDVTLKPISRRVPVLDMGAGSAPARHHPVNGSGTGNGTGTVDGTANGTGDRNRGGLRAKPSRRSPTRSARPMPDAGNSLRALNARDEVAISSLMAEITRLQDRIDEVQTTWSSDDGDDEMQRLAELILKEFDVLPTRIAGAISAALQEQHRAIMREVRAALRESKFHSPG